MANEQNKWNRQWVKARRTCSMNWLSSTLNAAEDFLNKVDAGAANLKAGTDVAATTFHKGGDGGGGFGTITEVVDASRGDEEEEDSSYDDEEHEQRAVFRSIAEMRPKGQRPHGHPSQSPLSPILSVGEPSPQAKNNTEDWLALLESEEPSGESLSPRKKKAINFKDSATRPLSKLDRDSSDFEHPPHGLPRPADSSKKETAVATAAARPFTSPKRTPNEKAPTTTNSRSSSPSSCDPEPEQPKPPRSKYSKPRNRESTKPEDFSKMIELGRSAVRERFSAAAEAALEGDSIRRGSLAAAESHAKQLASLREACLAQADRWSEEAGRQMIMRSQMEQSAMDLQDSALASAKDLADSQRRLADITSLVLSQRNELDLQSRQNDRLRRELDKIQERGGEEESENESGRGSRSPRRSPRSPRREGSERGDDSIEEELAETIREIEVLERRKARLSDRIQEKQATSPEESTLDAELSRATDALLSLQSEIETLSVRRQGLRMKCETLRNEQSATSSSSSLQGTDGYRNGVTDLEDPPRDKKNSTVGSLCGLATIAEHKGWVSKQVVHFAAALDSLSLFGGTVLESNRTARIFLYVYVVVLHVWFYFVVSKLA